MTQTIRIALVGAGFAGQAHAFGYRNAQMSDALSGLRITLDTVVDPNLELAGEVARRYGFRRTTAFLDEMLTDPDIDAVSVALPNFAYLDVLTRILRSGKHVFAEKPLGTSAEEAETLAHVARESGRVAGVGFSFRRVPALAAAQRAVRDGVIGTPYFARGFYYADYAADPMAPRTWRYVQEQSGGGALIDIGMHVIDALTHALGPVSQVSSATLHTVIAERPLPTGGGIGHVAKASETETGIVTTDDTALLTLRFASDCVGAVQLSRVANGAPNQLGIEIFGSKGHVSFDSTRSDEYALYEASNAMPGVDGPRRVIAGPAMPYYSQVSPMRARGTGTGYGEAFIAEIQDFLVAVTAGAELGSSFEAAVHPMRVVGAALESARMAHPVDVLAVD